MSTSPSKSSVVSPLRPRFTAVARIPGALVLALIRFYQHFISPAVPVVTLGQCACRFIPSCSHYAAEAVQVHGAARGLWLSVCRLVKCTPLHPGGHDPVPPRRPRRCVSVPSRFSAASPSLPFAPPGRT